MPDIIKAVAHDSNDESYTIVYQFDDGQNPPKDVAINILKGESTDLASAKELADQRAADAKQAWQDDLTILQTIIGPVELPKSTRQKAEPAEAAVIG